MITMERILEILFGRLATFNNSIFNRLHSLLVNNYLLYYDTLDKYQTRRQPSEQRKLLYNTIIVIIISAFIKADLITIYDDDWSKWITGEVIFVFYSQYRRLYLFIIFLCTFTILLKLTMFYYENNVTIDFYKLVSSEYGFNLSYHHRHSLLIIANAMYWVVKLILPLCDCIMLIAYLILNIQAYCDTEY